MTKITVQVTINAPLDKVWELMNAPEAIEQWNQASPDWHCLNAENNLIVGGSLKSTMAAKDGSFAFDFEGIYNEIVPFKLIRYHLLDQRMVTVVFKEKTTNKLQLLKHLMQKVKIATKCKNRAGRKY